MWGHGTKLTDSGGGIELSVVVGVAVQFQLC